MDTLRSFKAKLRICKENNENIIKSQERQEELKVAILQILLGIQIKKKNDLDASYQRKHKSNKRASGLWKHGLEANGVECNKSKKRHRQASEDTIR